MDRLKGMVNEIRTDSNAPDPTNQRLPPAVSEGLRGLPLRSAGFNRSEMYLPHGAVP
jgi:hypothetical protein